jgi:hypothetical protein
MRAVQPRPAFSVHVSLGHASRGMMTRLPMHSCASIGETSAATASSIFVCVCDVALTVADLGDAGRLGGIDDGLFCLVDAVDMQGLSAAL